MGIPSYYKRLLDRQPTLVTKAHPGSIDWLWMDFNCLIYHCLRSPDLRPFPGTACDADALAWENELLHQVVRYTERVVREVGPKAGVYIAVDGVVPMAKMRQQRLRRFKSSWLSEMGLAEGQVAGVARWDSNALTPGTAFMGRLRRTFEELIGRRPAGAVPWRFSSSDEPGEGEHKIMAQWRLAEGYVAEGYVAEGYRAEGYVAEGYRAEACRAEASECMNYAVYGLDADLVVLSLLTQDTLRRAGQPLRVWLFREEVEAGVMQRDEKGETVFQWFDVNVLQEQVRGELRGSMLGIQDYCCAMSFLGNDFLPVSLSLKMREDGHEQLMTALRRLRSPLVNEEGVLMQASLQELLAGFADTEEGRVWKTIDRKRLMASRVTGEAGLGEVNWALVQGAEDCLLDLGTGKPRPSLLPNWRSLYYTKLLGGVEPAIAVQKYLEGMQWVWEYYKGGKDICYNWVYPWALPPLWGDLVAALLSGDRPPAPSVALRSTDIHPVEQLCLVLPPASGGLVPGGLGLGSRIHERFTAAAPWLFPVSFGFGSAGKRWFWECEPEIPVPTLLEVKAVLAKLT